jgi:hypothetical protein
MSVTLHKWITACVLDWHRLRGCARVPLASSPSHIFISFLNALHAFPSVCRRIRAELCCAVCACVWLLQLGSPDAALAALAAAGAHSSVKDDAWQRISNTDPEVRLQGWRLLVTAAVASDDWRVFGRVLQVGILMQLLCNGQLATTAGSPTSALVDLLM